MGNKNSFLQFVGCQQKSGLVNHLDLFSKRFFMLLYASMIAISKLPSYLHRSLVCLEEGNVLSSSFKNHYDCLIFFPVFYIAPSNQSCQCNIFSTTLMKIYSEHKFSLSFFCFIFLPVLSHLYCSNCSHSKCNWDLCSSSHHAAWMRFLTC